MKSVILLVLSLSAVVPPQTRSLPEAAAFKSELAAVFDVIWFESLLTAFSGTGSSASALRHYTYSEYDTVSLNATKTTYRLGPYHAIGTDNRRVWFQEFADELRFSDVEKQDRDRMTLQARIQRVLEANPEDHTAAAEALDLTDGFDIRVLLRESINGRDGLVLAVKANRNYRPKTPIGDLARRFDVRVWIDEETRNVIRLEAQLLAPVYMDLVFREGSSFLIERQSAQGKEWLPAKSEVSIPRFGRLASHYSGFERFVTESVLKFGEPGGSPQP